MRIGTSAAAVAIATLLSTGAAEAKGCIKGAIIGGIAGHYLAERVVVGAVAGYALVEAGDGGRKTYRVTPEGEAFLAANRATVDDLFSRIGADGEARQEGVPAPVVRGMENLKLALRLRLKRGPIDQATAETIAAALDSAAQAVERT